MLLIKDEGYLAGVLKDLFESNIVTSLSQGKQRDTSRRQIPLVPSTVLAKSMGI